MTKHSPHPFSAVRDIPNVFYFTNTHPSRYDPRHYFLTFSNLHSSNKDKYHQYWEEAILILRSSRAEKFKKIGDYLYTAWKTSSHGVDEFWKERKQAESNDDSNDDDFLKTLAWTRKRTLQSARHQLGLAFDALDDNASYPSSSKRPRAPEQVQVENKEEGREENQSDDGASQGSSVSRIVLDIRPLPAPEETSIFYLSGDGSTNCSQKFWTPWIVAEKDISSNIWKYRQTVCKKARELMPLSGSVEKL
ncbi:hypothetical protein BGX31_007696 [Mortierella sp. GBA43]|nr:hypothetical protein BGX31_007696 [Mortierella sp. GBA43]